MEFATFDFELALLKAGVKEGGTVMTPYEIYQALSTRVQQRTAAFVNNTDDAKAEALSDALTAAKSELQESEFAQEMSSIDSFLSTQPVLDAIWLGSRSACDLIPFDLEAPLPASAAQLHSELAWYCGHFREEQREDAIQMFLWMRYSKRGRLLAMWKMLFEWLKPENVGYLQGLVNTLREPFYGWSAEDRLLYELRDKRGKEDEKQLLVQRYMDEESVKERVKADIARQLFQGISAAEEQTLSTLIIIALNSYRVLESKHGLNKWSESFLEDCISLKPRILSAPIKFAPRLKVKHPDCIFMLPLQYYVSVMNAPTANATISRPMSQTAKLFQGFVNGIIAKLGVSAEDVATGEGTVNKQRLEALWSSRLYACTLQPIKPVFLMQPRPQQPPDAIAAMAATVNSMQELAPEPVRQQPRRNAIVGDRPAMLDMFAALQARRIE